MASSVRRGPAQEGEARLRGVDSRIHEPLQLDRIELSSPDRFARLEPPLANWIRPRYSRSQIDAAGDSIRPRNISGKPIQFQVILNWRAAHWFPLNTVAQSLKKHTLRIDSDATVATRVKRFWSIRKKLQRMRRLSLYEMQDLGGARAIVNNCDSIDALRTVYEPSAMKRSRFLTEVIHTDDYLATPKADGYRGVHLILKFKGRNPDWDGLLIEVQLRTRDQHAWATTVEILETVLKQRLRTTQGDASWKRFLALMSSAIALSEVRAPVPGTPGELSQIRTEILELDASIHVKETLRGVINAVAKAPRFGKGTTWTVLDMRPEADETSAYAFPRSDLADAVKKLAEVEQSITSGEETDPGANAVLVSVSSIEKLREAYPNYYLDADAFLRLYDRLILGIGSPSGETDGGGAAAPSAPSQT